jgi:hypothetical protein
MLKSAQETVLITDLTEMLPSQDTDRTGVAADSGIRAFRFLPEDSKALVKVLAPTLIMAHIANGFRNSPGMGER